MTLFDAPLALLDYAVTLGAHGKSFYQKPPKKWKEGFRGDVILIQGWAEVWTFLEEIGNSLNRNGYRVHVLQELEHNTFPIDYCLTSLENYIEKNDLTKFHLVGHSKGAKLAKHFANESKFSNRVDKIVCVAGAWEGTQLAKTKFWNLNDVSRHSEFLRILAKNTTNHHKILNLYPRFDTMIFPHESLILSGAKNIEIDVVGHARVLFAKATLSEILAYLRD